MNTLTYAQLKLLVENDLVIKPEKLSLDEFYQWTLLTENYNFFQLLPYLQGEDVKLSYHDLIHDDWKILHETLTH